MHDVPIKNASFTLHMKERNLYQKVKKPKGKNWQDHKKENFKEEKKKDNEKKHSKVKREF